MSTLLFPGRHLVNTRFQEELLARILGKPPTTITALHRGRAVPATPLTKVVFAVDETRSARAIPNQNTLTLGYGSKANHNGLLSSSNNS